MADDGFGWSEKIAALSLGVSAIALLWAKASADAAKQANRLQLHSYRRSLLLGFNELLINAKLGHMVLKFDKAFIFEEHSKTCYLYVDDDLADRIKIFYDQCIKVAQINDEKSFVDENLRNYDTDIYPMEGYKKLAKESHDLQKKSLEIVKENLPFGDKILSDLRRFIKFEDSKPDILAKLYGVWVMFCAAYNEPFDWGDEEETD